eukprot:CAMPEP_0196770550 /NCGR_PEP_ID=MMETSP1104-20130614/1204_1 /TAXON_ID=33652 /ORGANISM="Cafeteria sp., Strain Caron Lab Isolate" /LENGTH=74 /DNA_ID=CAMNT_0042140663 /DNA_START=192 /DNA_END=416 /DNA_ORIENTATION=+
MSNKMRKQLDKTEQEIARLEREVEILETAVPPEEACRASIEYARNQKEPMYAPSTPEDPNPWTTAPNPGCCVVM